MTQYIPTIGLEIHSELKTQTKMFCGCKNDPDEKRPNLNVCPVCLAHPGTLPTINEDAVKAVVRLGMAVGAKIATVSKFDRKNYFYPDLPKGYQISQYDKPLVEGGKLAGVRITRVHLEEDTGRIQHTTDNNNNHNDDKDSGYRHRQQLSSSLVDFNRAGIPLMELVTEPDIHNAEQAVRFAKELQLILRYLEISDADMEKGQMRVEVNISLSNPSPMDSNGPRIMLKNKSYDLMRLLFEVHNKLGPIYKEKNYQDAIEEILKREGIKYEREKLVKLKFENLEISDFFVDFVIDDQIALEVKAKSFINEDDIRQASRYTKSLNIPLAILVNFKHQKLEYKRVVNPVFENDSSLFEDNSRKTLGTKVEIKNLNSFRAVGEATDYEIKRQTEALNRGEKIVQETRGWDDAKKITKSQRLKEESHDYRYFPEPDLPPLDLTKFDLDGLRASLPELPEEKRERFRKEYKLKKEQIEILVNDMELADYFENTISEQKEKRAESSVPLAVNYILTDVIGMAAAEGMTIVEVKSKIPPEHLAHLIVFIEEGKLSSRMAKDIISEMAKTGRDPEDIIQEKGMIQVSDEENLKKAIEEVITENPAAMEDYKKGKTTAVQFLVGKTMAKLHGKGNPQAIQRILANVLTKLN